MCILHTLMMCIVSERTMLYSFSNIKRHYSYIVQKNTCTTLGNVSRTFLNIKKPSPRSSYRHKHQVFPFFPRTGFHPSDSCLSISSMFRTSRLTRTYTKAPLIPPTLISGPSWNKTLQINNLSVQTTLTFSRTGVVTFNHRESWGVFWPVFCNHVQVRHLMSSAGG